MPAVAVLFLTAAISVLVTRLASKDLLNFVRPYVGLKKKLGKWKKMLAKIQTVLADADKRQKEEAVKLWLDDLIDLAYDIEDRLDDFTTEMPIGENQASTSKLRKLTPACCTPLTPRAFKKITTQFDKILKEKDELGLIENVNVRGNIRDTPSTSVVDEHSVYGRQRDKEAILEFLLNQEYNDAGVSVIPIHGMGGVGKTTLAKLVFHAATGFRVKVWAYVSNNFNVPKLTQTIFTSVISQICEDEDIEARDKELWKIIRDGNDLDSMQRELKRRLSERKFLVILDDVWTHDYEKWNELRAFLRGTPESRIIITTRDRGVSSKMGTVPPHSLEVLSDEDCLSVFTHHALAGKSFSTAAPNLQGIGKKIGEKCKGLPLAALTFGGLLRSNEELNHRTWEDVSKRRILDAPKERDAILLNLMWSYDDLPLHLKRCFVYCSIIPEGYEFEKKQLVLLWMAEGLIQPQRDKQMEDLGSEYFIELEKKSFFQKSSGSRFKMHDFINNLAQWLARDTCSRMEDRAEEILKKARHLSHLCGHGNCPNNFEALSKLTRLRTFLPLVPDQGTHSFTSNIVSLQLLSILGRLRVLSLSGYGITELPESIGDLKRLRYLDLSNNRIESMPESTTKLYNLQTLILEDCPALKKLPSIFRNLVNMRHLNIQKTCSLEEMPPQMDKLTCLHTLSDFVVGKGTNSGVKELEPLSHLRVLCISRLENVIRPGDAKGANLIQKANLRRLLLEWSPNVDEQQDRTIDREVLNELQPHEALNELSIKCYGDTIFPIWLRTPSFPNMVCLRLEDCKKCTSLPSVGQLSSLRYLYIIGMAGVLKVGPEFYEGGCLRPFGSLKTLCFKNMAEWENWNLCGEFPHLRELSCQNCPKLSFQNYPKLSVQNCPKLSSKLRAHFPLLEAYDKNGSPLLPEIPTTRVVRDSSHSQAETSRTK